MSTVMIVDDDSTIRIMLVKAFQIEGYDVFEASGGKEAIKLYKDNIIDVVITDIVMPDMEGIETMQKLQEINPNAKIIAFSGGGSVSPDSYLKIAAAMGAQYTFQKPISIEELRNAVKELLDS